MWFHPCTRDLGTLVNAVYRQFLPIISSRNLLVACPRGRANTSGISIKHLRDVEFPTGKGDGPTGYYSTAQRGRYRDGTIDCRGASALACGRTLPFYGTCRSSHTVCPAQHTACRLTNRRSPSIFSGGDGKFGGLASCDALPSSCG